MSQLCYDHAVMPLFTYGINHKTAPIAIREQWGFNKTQVLETLCQMKHHGAMNEAVILSTCNRTEIYTTETHDSALTSWLKECRHHDYRKIKPHAYSYHGLDAIEHAMRVASGLDSMILGEPQILGQMKQAYQLACQAGTVGAHFQRLFPSIFSASKNIRHNTDIGKNAISLAYVIFQIAQRIYTSLETCRLLLIGSGEMIDLVATYFSKQKTLPLIIAGRNLERTQAFAASYQGHAICMGDIPQYMQSVDIVVSATASQLPIIGKGMMERTLKRKKRRPLLMVDLALPRDIEPEVAELEDIYLYNMDDLQKVIWQNKKHRESAAKQAEAMLLLQAEHYFKQLRILNAQDVIACYRQQVEALRDQALQKALEELRRGTMAECVLQKMAYSLSNKVMHQPTTALRQAAYENQTDLLLLAKTLFGL